MWDNAVMSLCRTRYEHIFVLWLSLMTSPVKSMWQNSHSSWFWLRVAVEFSDPSDIKFNFWLIVAKFHSFRFPLFYALFFWNAIIVCYSYLTYFLLFHSCLEGCRFFYKWMLVLILWEILYLRFFSLRNIMIELWL